jgi:hypothetical protein
MASIEKYRTATGEPRYNVHWRVGNRSTERSFRRAKDAEAFKRHVETEPAITTAVDPARGAVLFGEYAAVWLSERRRTDGRPLAPPNPRTLPIALRPSPRGRFRCSAAQQASHRGCAALAHQTCRGSRPAASSQGLPAASRHPEHRRRGRPHHCQPMPVARCRRRALR